MKKYTWQEKGSRGTLLHQDKEETVLSYRIPGEKLDRVHRMTTASFNKKVADKKIILKEIA